MSASACAAPARPAGAGWSLTEMLVVVAVIAVMSAVVVPVYLGMVRSSQVDVARRNLNLLNGAVSAYNQINRHITNASGASLAVANLLKARDTSIPGSPFLASTMNITVTSAVNTYRANWNGAAFVRIDPGATGTGIDLMAVASRTP